MVVLDVGWQGWCHWLCSFALVPVSLLAIRSERLGHSFEASLLCAPVAVVETGRDADHAVQAGVVGRGHLGGRGAPHAADDLNGDGRGDVHAGPVGGCCGEVRLGGRGGRRAAVVEVGGARRGHDAVWCVGAMALMCCAVVVVMVLYFEVLLEVLYVGGQVVRSWECCCLGRR